MKLAIKTGDENVQVGLQRAQMIEGVLIYLSDDAWVEVVIGHRFRSDR